VWEEPLAITGAKERVVTTTIRFLVPRDGEDSLRLRCDVREHSLGLIEGEGPALRPAEAGKRASLWAHDVPVHDTAATCLPDGRVPEVRCWKVRRYEAGKTLIDPKALSALNVCAGDGCVRRLADSGCLRPGERRGYGQRPEHREWDGADDKVAGDRVLPSGLLKVHCRAGL